MRSHPLRESVHSAIAGSRIGFRLDSYTIWCIETTPAEIAAAFRLEDESQIAFWDALIVASAVKSGASRILSEDLSGGQRIAGVLIENPFVGVH